MVRHPLLSGLLWVGVAFFSSPSAIRPQSVDLSYNAIDAHFAPAPTPPDPGLYPPEVQQAIEEGYRQLALVAAPSDDLHLDAAKVAFERAIEIDPAAIHAWNGMGIYELTKDEQWLVVLESLKKLFDRDHISMAIKAFEKALEADPAFHPARYNLALAYRQARGTENYRRALAELQRLVDEAPDFPDASLLLAITYRDAGNLQGLIAAAESLPAGTSSFPPAGRQLLLAYALANTDRPEEGAAAYWTGIDAIATERESELYWYDIRPLASVEENDAFLARDLEDRRSYLRNFWQRSADPSFVSANARLVEHYRRLKTVIENYRLGLPERRHYSGIAAYVPPWQTGFDDRGVIYLRHGKPDDVATYSGPAVERNVSWKYERASGDPLVFHFVSDEDVEDFKLVRRLGDAVIQGSTKLTGQTVLNTNCSIGRLVNDPCDSYDSRILASDLRVVQDLYSSRGHLDPYYDRAATNLDPQILEVEESDLARDVAFGTTTHSFAPETGGEPLGYPVDPVPFKNAAGGTTLAFYFALPTAQLGVVPHAGGGSQVDYRYQLVVNRGDGGDPVARQADDVTVASARPISREAGVMLPAVRSLEVPPGEYGYGMQVTDLNSGRRGVVRGTLVADDFSTGGLSMSGVVLADRIEPATDPGNPFVRWGRFKVLPLPSHMFRRAQPVFVYYEVYGLDSGSTGEPRYRTTYTLESQEPDRNVVARFFSALGELLTGGAEEGAITYSFERSQAGAEHAVPLLEFFSLDVSDSDPGVYRLTVEVEDLEAGGTVRKSVPLTLVN
ncbi:MAG TPA: GWxTD domain-containing protein [Gemmatimonadota bacterium]|nr:GWxTD domain-containing protein [Gemmatimonadota bacterium]